MNYTYLFDAAWLFLALWIVVLLAVGLIAFGRDLRSLPSGQPTTPEERR